MSKKTKKQSSSTPTPQVIQDPILEWWENWRKPITMGFLAIVVIAIGWVVFGRIQKSRRAAATTDVVRVVDAPTVDQAKALMSDLDGERQNLAKVALLQRMVGDLTDVLTSEGQEKLAEAKKLAGELDSAEFVSKLVAEGPTAMGLESPTSPVKEIEQAIAVKGSVGDAVAVFDYPPADATKVVLEIVSGDKTHEVTLLVLHKQVPTVADAFLESVKAGHFDNLFLYSKSLGAAKVLRFGDPRARADVATSHLPPETSWGTGLNRAPVAWVKSPLPVEQGSIAALVDPRSGKCSAREIAIFHEEDVKSNFYSAAPVVFAIVEKADGDDAFPALDELVTAFEDRDAATQDEKGDPPFIKSARVVEGS